MALAQCTVSGVIQLPDTTVPVHGAKLVFVLSNVEEDTEIVAPIRVEANVNVSTGAFSVDLWPNALGTAESAYYVTLERFGATAARPVAPISLGTIYVPDSASAAFSALIQTPPFTPPSASILALADAAKDAAAASAVEAAASAVEAEASAVEAADSEAAALAAVIQYETRAAAVSAISGGLVPTNGITYLIDGLSYIGSTGATDILDMPGMLPNGDVYFEHFGVVGATFANQGVNLQAAMDYCGATEKKLIGENGPYYISQTLTMDKPFHFYMPFVADTTSSNPADSITNCLSWMGAGGANKMMVVKSATSGARIKYGRIDAMFDANNIASHCIHGSSWDNFTLGNVLTYRAVTCGTLIDDGNSALLNNPIIERLTHFCGSNVLAHNCDGLIIDGDTTGFFATQAYIQEYLGEYIAGDAFTIRGIDNCTFVNIMPIERYGATITGEGIRIAKSVNYPSFHAQKNLFVHIGRGSVYVEDFTAYQRCLFMNGEGTSVVFESAFGDADRGTFWYDVGDRNSGAFYRDRQPYNLLDLFDLPVASAIAVTGTPAIVAFGGYGVTALAFDSASTETAVFAPIKPLIDDGDIIGFDLVSIQAGGASGNVRWQFEAITKADAVGFGSAEVTQSFTQAMNGTGNTTNTSRFYLAAPLSTTRGDMICVRISRLGADALDTFVNDVGVMSLRLIYKTDGPDAPGSGPYEVSNMEIS